MVKSLEFELALPPADDAKHGIWLHGAAAEMQVQIGEARLQGPTRLDLAAGVVADERVLVGIAALVVRLLTGRVIEGAHCVTDIIGKWNRTLETGRVRVCIRETTPPARRIDAATRARISVVSRARWAREREKAAAAASI